MFKISRNDADILVMPNKYVDELRSFPDEKLSAIRAHIKVCRPRFQLFNKPRANNDVS